jgi:hypothetical protein
MAAALLGDGVPMPPEDHGTSRKRSREDDDDVPPSKRMHSSELFAMKNRDHFRPWCLDPFARDGAARLDRALHSLYRDASELFGDGMAAAHCDDTYLARRIRAAGPAGRATMPTILIGQEVPGLGRVTEIIGKGASGYVLAFDDDVVLKVTPESTDSGSGFSKQAVNLAREYLSICTIYKRLHKNMRDVVPFALMPQLRVPFRRFMLDTDGSVSICVGFGLKRVDRSTLYALRKNADYKKSLWDLRPKSAREDLVRAWVGLRVLHEFAGIAHRDAHMGNLFPGIVLDFDTAASTLKSRQLPDCPGRLAPYGYTPSSYSLLDSDRVPTLIDAEMYLISIATVMHRAPPWYGAPSMKAVTEEFHAFRTGAEHVDTLPHVRAFMEWLDGLPDALRSIMFTVFFAQRRDPEHVNAVVSALLPWLEDGFLREEPPSPAFLREALRALAAEDSA